MNKTTKNTNKSKFGDLKYEFRGVCNDIFWRTKANIRAYVTDEYELLRIRDVSNPLHNYCVRRNGEIVTNQAAVKEIMNYFGEKDKNGCYKEATLEESQALDEVLLQMQESKKIEEGNII